MRDVADMIQQLLPMRVVNELQLHIASSPGAGRGVAVSKAVEVRADVKSNGREWRHDFKTPNGRALAQIDSFFQSVEDSDDEKIKSRAKRWDRAVNAYFPREFGGDWPGVQREHPGMFFQARDLAVARISDRQLDPEKPGRVLT